MSTRPWSAVMVSLTDAWAQAEVAEQAAGMQADLGWVLDPDHTGHGYRDGLGCALLAEEWTGTTGRGTTGRFAT